MLPLALKFFPNILSGVMWLKNATFLSLTRSKNATWLWCKMVCWQTHVARTRFTKMIIGTGPPVLYSCMCLCNVLLIFCNWYRKSRRATLLHSSAEFGCVHIAKLLLSCKANVNAKDDMYTAHLSLRFCNAMRFCQLSDFPPCQGRRTSPPVCRTRSSRDRRTAVVLQSKRGRERC
jgi:hypothetical protein